MRHLAHRTAIAITLGLLLLPGLSRAERTVRSPGVSVGGSRVRVTMPRSRRAMLGFVSKRLERAGTPGYGVLFRTTKVKHAREGGLVVAAVNNTWSDKSAGHKWYDAVGKYTIGFQSSAKPGSTGGSSGYVRIGKKWMSYNWVRGNDSSTSDIRDSTSSYTEATFIVSKKTMKAFDAFYHARHHKLIKDSKGRTIDPGWNNPGPSNLKVEGCAGAASSGLNPTWVRAFKRNIQAIRAYGEQNNIPELKNMPHNAADLILKFIKRNGARQQTDPRVLVRTHSLSAAMLTIFNGVDAGRPPLEALKWDRSIKFYTKPSYSPNAGQRVRDKNHASWIGLGQPHTIFDDPNGAKQKSFVTERMSLSDFGSTLGR